MKLEQKIQLGNLIFLTIMFITFSLNGSAVLLIKGIQYDYHAYQYSKSNITQEIIQACDNYNTSYSTIACVELSLFDKIKYRYNGSTLYPPEVIFETGGDCKEWTVLYRTIFSELGFDSAYRFVPGHVYLTVYGEDVYANIDIDEFEIYKMS